MRTPKERKLEEHRQEMRDKKCPPAERAMIQTFMAKLPREITIEETKVLAKLFTRHPEAMKLAIEAARAAFISKADIYLQKHVDSVRAAYAAGEFDVAAQHAEWALERIGTKEGMLIEGPPTATEGGNKGPQILIGVNMGGVKTPAQPVIDVVKR